MNFVREICVLVCVITAGIVVCPDVAGVKTALFAVSLVCIISSLLALVVGVSDRWGILPDVSFRRDIARALSTPDGASRVVAGFLIFLGLVILGIFKAA